MAKPPPVSPEHARLIRKLESIYPLSPQDRAAAAGLPLRFAELAENVDIVREGDRPESCCLLLEGFICRYGVLGQGQRQIYSFHVPGDIPDLQSLHLPVMDHSLGTLTPVRVAFIPHAAIHAAVDAHPGLAAAMWRDTLIDAAVFRQWLAGVGRRTAHQRIAHVICEVYIKLKAVGLTEDHRFQFPVTQTEIADSLGLSAVHVNRVLQDLRGSGMISWTGPNVEIHDWEQLKAAGDFDPGYLVAQAAE